MNIANILIVLILAGALLYILQVLPIDATLKLIARVLVIVLVAIWVIRLLAGSNLIPGF